MRRLYGELTPKPDFMRTCGIAGPPNWSHVFDMCRPHGITCRSRGTHVAPCGGHMVPRVSHMAVYVAPRVHATLDADSFLIN